MAVDYQYFEYRAFEYLIRLRQILESEKSLNCVQPLLDGLKEEEEMLRTRKFRVAVVGEFNNGKSSFINALLGREILPVDALPMTATLNRITYGSVPRSCLVYKDGTREDVPIDQLSQYVTKLTGESEENAARIAEAVVEYPSIFCQNHVDLIDTPGLNDNEAMNEVTLSQLEQIDLAIVTLSPNSPFSDTECQFMVNLLESEEVCQIVVVVTKIDQVRGEAKRQKLMDYLKEQIPLRTMEKLRGKYEEDHAIFQKAQRILDRLSLYAVCSLDALDARRYNDEELMEKSGFTKLNEELPGLILASQNNSAVLRAVNRIHKTVSNTEGGILPLVWQECEQRRQQILQARQDVAGSCYHLVEGGNLKERVSAWTAANLKSFMDAQILVARKQFIRCLCSLQTLNPDVMERAISKEAMSVNQQLNQTIQMSLNIKLTNGLIEIITLWQQEIACQVRSELLRSDITAAWAETKQIEQAMEPLLANLSIRYSQVIRSAWSELKFFWTATPVPEREHLQDEDLIEQIVDAVRESLLSYSSRCSQKMMGILDQILSDAAADMETLVLAVYEVSNAEIGLLKERAKRFSDSDLIRKMKQIDEENTELEREFYRQMSAVEGTV